MLDRLKTLPLTILLTILIWMYAESQSNPMTRIETVTLEDVPVLISGPPDALSQYQVVLESSHVKVTLSGPGDKIAPIHDHASTESEVTAYLDIKPGDKPSDGFIHRPLRFVTPPGTTVNAPPEVGFQLEAKKTEP